MISEEELDILLKELKMEDKKEQVLKGKLTLDFELIEDILMKRRENLIREYEENIKSVEGCLIIARKNTELKIFKKN